MNWYKIIGVILILGAVHEMERIVSDYSSGKLAFWPFGAEVGAGLTIWLGIFLIKRGARKKKQFQ